MSLSDRKRNSRRNKTNSLLTLDRINAQSASGLSVDLGSLVELPLDKIIPDPNQPRKKIQNIENLAQTISENELIQPVIVRQLNNQYMIIAGERRYRAFCHLGRQTMPCIIKNTSSVNDILVMQLLENDQREQMHPLEVSSAINSLAKTKNFSITEMSKKLGVSKDWVSTRKQLMHIEKDIQQLAVDGKILDVRTLIDLNRLHNIDAKICKMLIAQIKNKQLKGSYRAYVQQAIEKINNFKSREPTIKPMQRIEYLDEQKDRVIIKVSEKKQPLIFIKTNSYHVL